MNFVDMILFHARTIPEQPAIAFSERVIPYQLLGRGILSAERRLSELGVVPGNLVAIEIDNPIAHLVMICALERLGVASLSLAGGSKEPLDDLGITLLLKDRPDAAAVSTPVQIVDDGWLNGPPMAYGGGKGFADPNATSRVVLSSGTTGRAKPLLFSAAVLNTRFMILTNWLAAPAWDRMLCLPGLSTIFGFAIAAVTLLQGRMICFVPAAADAALEAIGRHRIDAIAAAPNQLQMMIDARKKRPTPCGSLNVVHVAGSLLTDTFINQVRAELCNTVIGGYGATEVGMAAYGPADRYRGIDGAVGFVAPWAQVEIVDADGAPCGHGQEGEVRMRCDGQAGRYPPEMVTAADGNFRDGWFYPGDTARLGADGFLIITGRSKQLINAGGVKLAPDLIDEMLQAHPDIADAGAIGMVGSSGIEEIWVAVVLRRPIAAADIIEYCRQRDPKMAPRQVRFVAAIPRNAMGKIVRESLKQLMSA